LSIVWYKYIMSSKKGKSRRKGEFEKTLSHYKQIYNRFGSIKCPAFNNAEVVFNTTGWNHLCNGKWRTEKEQMKRMELLPYAKKLIGLTTTIQSIRTYHGFRTFEFNANMDGMKITAIVSQTKRGYVFLSNFRDDSEGLL